MAATQCQSAVAWPRLKALPYLRALLPKSHQALATRHSPFCKRWQPMSAQLQRAWSSAPGLVKAAAACSRTAGLIESARSCRLAQMQLVEGLSLAAAHALRRARPCA